MSPFLLYLVKSALCIAIFYIYYTSLLSRDTMYARNRVFILLSVFSAMVLPFITIETSRPVGEIFFGKTLSEVLISGNSSAAHTGNGYSMDWTQLIIIIYISGIILSIFRVLFNLVKLYYLIKNKRVVDSNIIKFSGLNTAGFSAIRYIFINSSLSGKDAEEVLRHENKHLEHKHFLDILFMEIIKSIQWFNPFIYLFDRTLRAVHEFQADEGYLKSGIPVFSYQQLLMKQVFKSGVFTFINSFSNPTLIKKRMIMMTKKRSKMLANLKILMVLPVIAILLIAFSSCKDKQKVKEVEGEELVSPPPPPASTEGEEIVKEGEAVSSDTPPPPPPPSPPYTVNNGDTTWIVVDEMPVFPGGDESLLEFIAEKTIYPENAKEERIQGRVVVQFVVETDGRIDKAQVLKSINPELDAEALRVINSLPPFEKPGIINGRSVPVRFMVPITFTLK
jgi:TonB family protein